MPEKYLYIANDPVLQSQAVELLCRCFDEWVDFSNKYGKCFPFHEESFAAFDEKDNMLGHVGIMPFEIRYGESETLRVAGLASVGVIPEARNRNIAHNLCCAAADWAEKADFDLMLLYTGAARVYEKSHWQCFTPPYSMLKNTSESSGGNWKKGCELSEKEKSFIRECYNSSMIFSGMVKRSDDPRFFHSWNWMWQNPANLWQVTRHGYSVKSGNSIGEIAGDLAVETISELVSGAEYTFLHPLDKANTLLQKLNWQVLKNITAPPCWYGETAMYKVFNKSINTADIFMPLTDKF